MGSAGLGRTLHPRWHRPLSPSAPRKSILGGGKCLSAELGRGITPRSLVSLQDSPSLSTHTHTPLYTTGDRSLKPPRDLVQQRGDIQAPRWPRVGIWGLSRSSALCRALAPKPLGVPGLKQADRAGHCETSKGAGRAGTWTGRCHLRWVSVRSGGHAAGGVGVCSLRPPLGRRAPLEFNTRRGGEGSRTACSR